MFDWKYRFVKARLHAYINGELSSALRRYVARQIDTDVRCYQEYRRQMALRDEFEYQLAKVGRASPTRIQHMWENIHQDIAKSALSRDDEQTGYSKRQLIDKPTLAYTVVGLMMVLFVLLPLNLYSLGGNIAVPSQPSPESLFHTPTPAASSNRTSLIAYVAETQRAYEIHQVNKQFLANTPAPLLPSS